MSATTIEWTDDTWNPVRGCTKISPGCTHCYASTFAERWRGVKGHPYEQGFDLRLVPEKLQEPLTWKKPRRVFVNSMSDLFHEDVPDEFIDRVFAVMALADRHTFQVLTKRPERMRAYFAADYRWAFIEGEAQKMYAAANKGEDPSMWLAVHGPLTNCWLGVSVESQQYVPRIRELLATPAAVRFLSYEPALGPLDLSDGYLTGRDAATGSCVVCAQPVRCRCEPGFPSLDWVICGGESGPGARPMHPDWARSIRDQCEFAGVPYFFKQFGEYSPIGEYDRHAVGVCEKCGWFGPITTMAIGKHRNGPDGCNGSTQAMYRVGKKAAGRLLDGIEWNQYPEDRQ